MQATSNGSYCILEHFAENTEEKELAEAGMMLWGNMNYNFNEATMGYVQNSNFEWGLTIDNQYYAKTDNNYYSNLLKYCDDNKDKLILPINITTNNYMKLDDKLYQIIYHFIESQSKYNLIFSATPFSIR
mgnify:CR=1 FL=1